MLKSFAKHRLREMFKSIRCEFRNNYGQLKPSKNKGQNMKPRDIFKIIVATAGLIIFCMGAVGLIGIVISAITSSSLRTFGVAYVAVVGIAEIIFGILIMKGFPPLVDIAFPTGHDEEDKTGDT
jgi:hypothetical protein